MPAMMRACYCCLAFLLSVTLALNEEGTYTIANCATGLRIFSSAHAGFALAAKLDPIYLDQLWVLDSQGDGSYAIVNAINGLRMVAKLGADGDADFFVIHGGPVFQDQRWLFDLQADGSHVITNAKSGRRLTILHGDPPRIAALASHGAALPEQTWWLINQDRDDSARLAAELLSERTARVAFSNETRSLQLQLHEAQGINSVLRLELQAHQSNASLLLQEIEERESHVAQVETELHRKDATVSELAGAVAGLSARLEQVSADLQEAESVNVQLLEDLEMRSFSGLAKQHQVEVFALALGLAIVVLASAFVSPCRRSSLRLACEAAEQQAMLLRSQRDVEDDCVEQTGDVVGELGVDFGFQIISRVADGVTERLIRIQCPGVSHDDVDVNLIFNGCDIAIQRQATCGTGATSWKKRFRFKTTDGLFEFKEDQMQLEHGILQLVFRAFTFRSRLIRFPRHFSLAVSDVDQCWEYPDYDDIGHSYEGVSWLEPEKELARSASQSHQDTESTASTARELC